jgi:DNA-binding transcriptional regulator GbsR (MarR family)
MAMALEGFGLPRMAGRVFAALLIANPAEQSAEALAQVLHASRGAISGATSLLETMGLIDRVRKTGDRKDYFRNKPNAWHEAMRKEMMALSGFRKLTKRGLELLDSSDPEVSRGLREMHDMLIFMEREVPALFERWNQNLQRTGQDP